MKENTTYACSSCGQTFTNKEKCFEHELTHVSENMKIVMRLLHENQNPCYYCKYSYFSYGCEFDCKNWKKCMIESKPYKLYIPEDPFHDKHISGC
jgi:hypothetical protein